MADRPIPEKAVLPPPVRALMWRWLRATGLERCELRGGQDGWRLQGTVLTMMPGRPAEVRYEVVCDADWRTLRTEVSLRDDAGERRLHIEVETGTWRANGRTVDAVAGCVDVDLGWSPSTNTLPIRRLRLAVGQASMVTAAWVRFPELTLQPLRQEYHRLSDRRYRYTNRDGELKAEIEVDEDGLVLEYETLWTRVEP